MFGVLANKGIYSSCTLKRIVLNCVGIRLQAAWHAIWHEKEYKRSPI